jgi:hypothetical protein
VLVSSSSSASRRVKRKRQGDEATKAVEYEKEAISYKYVFDFFDVIVLFS